jgi:hypothetical protein
VRFVALAINEGGQEMKSSVVTLVIGVAASIIALTCAQAQSEKFTKIDGASLSAKLAAAHSRAVEGKPYWVAYGFDVRPRVGFDLPDQASQPKVVVEASGPAETPNLGVFMLYKTRGANPARIEVYNLDRQRDYEGMPVFWLGKVPASESLDHLRKLVPQVTENASAENLTHAIALHNDSQSGVILEDLLQHATNEGVRRESAFWLGRIPGHLQSLADVVNKEQEALDVRKQAVMAIGKSREEGSGAMLQRLYTSSLSRDLKQEILEAAAKNRQAPALELLTTVGQSSDDMTLTARAQELLNKASGKKEKNKPGKSSQR